MGAGEMQKDSILRYEDGEEIFAEDSIGKEFYIIEDGKVEISQRIDGNKIIIAVLGKSDFFGEMAAITDAPRTATAISVGKTELVSLSIEVILQRMQADPQFTISLFQTLITRLRSTTSTLRILIARMYALDAGFVEAMFPAERHLKTEEESERLKEELKFRGKQIERQQAIIMQLSESIEIQRKLLEHKEA